MKKNFLLQMFDGQVNILIDLPGQVRNIKWQPPPEGTVKLNVNGASNEGNMQAGAG